MSKIRFVGEGRQGGPMRKKKVLSNKALTRRVRALSGQEGTRSSTVGVLYDNVTLTAATADINYVTGFNGLTNDVIHRIRFFINVVAAEDSTLRIILFEDSEPDVTEAVVANLFQVTADTWSGYVVTDIQPIGANRKTKNILAAPRRFRVLRDLLISQSLQDNSERYVRLLDLNMHGRKKTVENFELFMLVMSTGTPVVDVQFTIDHTDLDA